MIDAIRGLFRPDVPVDRLADVGPGVRSVDGVVRVEEPLRSPVRGQGCAAFLYRPILVIMGRQQPTIHKLKTHERYTRFELLMDGGVLPVFPRVAGDFDQTQHLELMKQYGEGFHAEEELVLPGARVRVVGKAVRDGDGWAFRSKRIEVLEAKVVKAGVVGDRKKRRKKKNRK